MEILKYLTFALFRLSTGVYKFWARDRTIIFKVTQRQKEIIYP